MLRQHQIVEAIQHYEPECDVASLDRAWVYGMKECGTAMTKGGEPFFSIPASIVDRIIEVQGRSELVSATLVGTKPARNSMREDEIRRLFGVNVQRLVSRIFTLRRASGLDPDDIDEGYRVVVAAALVESGARSTSLLPTDLVNVAAPIVGQTDINAKWRDDPVFLKDYLQEDIALKTALIDNISSNYDLIHQLSPRMFEIFVSDMLASIGYRTTVTKKTRDGGYDILATRDDGIFANKYLVECKKYTRQNKVNVEAVRRLYGVVSERNATGGIIVTTSSFTKPAVGFAEKVGQRMSLIDVLRIRYLIRRSVLLSPPRPI